MKKVFLLSTVLLTTLFVGCNDDDVQALGPTSTIVGFTSSSTSKSYVVDDPTSTFSLPIKLISYADGQFPTEDINMVWQLVDPTTYLDETLTEPQASDYNSTTEYEEALAAYQEEYATQLASFATTGVEFDLPSSNQLTLTEGEGFTELPVTVYPSSLVIGEPKKFIIELTTASNATIGYQYRRIMVTLNGSCASDLAGSYYITYTTGQQPINITEIEFGSYHSDYTPTFVSTYWFEFTDVCGLLTISTWQYQDANPMSGTNGGMPQGTVNDNGSITFTGVNVEGVSWYVDKSWTIYPN